MTATLLDTLTSKHGLPLVDETTIDAFLMPGAGEAAHSILFFAGDPAQRAETTDVAVILPELIACFGKRLRGGLVAQGYEKALKDRFHVLVLPSLVVCRGTIPVAVLPRVLDWAEYVERIHASLASDAPEVQPKRANVPFTIAQGGQPL
ncbi:MAG: hydrogenase accessory protein [Alsobacter sp.]